jgi:hypothetical protein
MYFASKGILVEDVKQERSERMKVREREREREPLNYARKGLTAFCNRGK